MPDQPLQILVVDDDFATRLLASEALMADGFEPLEAADGREALDQYDRRSPAAILLDVNMPGLDGYEVCRRIRMRPGGESTAVMVMTANDDLEAVQRAFAAGATDFLTKPLNLPLLAHRVRYMLRAAATATAAREAASRLARAQRLARIVHWELGAGARLTWASDPLAVFWPDAPDELGEPGDGAAADDPLAGDRLFRFVHPDDRARMAGVLTARAAHQVDFRLVFPDGAERIVHQDAELDFGDRGVVLIGASQDITEMKRAEQQIVQLAFYDDLTGIPNRPFIERLLRAAAPVPHAAIAIDLGSGHLDRLELPTRDLLIRAAAARVIERVRGADTEIRLDQVPRPIEVTGATVVARTGPDELVVVTRELGDGGAAGMARQLADALAQPFALAGRSVVLRPRLGVADYPAAGELHRLAELASGALHEAERIAPRNVVVLTAAARTQRIRRAELADELAVVLDLAQVAAHPELATLYAPRVEPASRRVLGVRAQPRWRPATGEPPPLAALFAVAPGLRDRLAGWTLAQACHDAGHWLAAGTALRVAVELPCRAVARPEFADELRRRFADARCEPLLFDLELLDLPSADDELDRLAEALAPVRALGVRIALACVDDRRTLGELRRLPLDALRVERTVIERLGPSLITTAAGLARGLTLRLALTELDAPAALAVLDSCEPDEIAGALVGAAVPAAGVVGLASDPAADWLRSPSRDVAVVAATD